MSGIYRDIRDQIQALWSAGWQHMDVPVYWRAQDVSVLPDPGSTRLFVRNELLFGHEQVIAFGGGRFGNERLKFGSLIIRVFADVELRDDSAALDLLSDAQNIYRAARYGALSFIGTMSSFDSDSSGEPTSDIGNWSLVGSQLVWEYRFTG